LARFDVSESEVPSVEEALSVAEDEWERDCRLQAEFHDDDQAARENCSNATPGPPPNFTTAKKFNGKREGTEFKLGSEGLGYYATRPNAISLANELAIPDCTQHPVTLHLQKLLGDDDQDWELLTAPNRKKAEWRRKQRLNKRSGELDSLQVAKAIKASRAKPAVVDLTAESTPDQCAQPPPVKKPEAQLGHEPASESG
jgi:hypothetical protein